jgi:hypothetical protein
MKRQRLPTARVTLRSPQTSTQSPDGMVTVTLDRRGEVSYIEFNAAECEQLTPAELGAVVVQTISRARARCRNRLFRLFGPFLLEGCLVRPSAGPDEFDEIFHNDERLSTVVMQI